MKAGLSTCRSGFSFDETVEKLETAVKAKGLTIFARIDHAAGAAAVGMMLRPTTVLILGNAKGGTPLMQAAQTTGIDLPLKALVWQDERGDVWLSYNDPSWIAHRHDLGDKVQAPINAMTEMLRAVAKIATGSA